MSGAALAMLVAVALIPLSVAWRGGVTRDLEQFLGARPISFVSGLGLTLATWLTVNTLLAAPEITYRMGIMGAFAYSAIGAVGLITFGWFYGRMARAWPGVTSVGEFVRRRFGAPLQPLLLAGILVYVLGALTAPVDAGGVLLERLLGIPFWLSSLGLYGATALLVAMGGFPAVLRASLFQLMLILLIVLVLPTLVYLNVSIPAVYEGIAARAPETFSFGAAEGWLFLAAGSLIAIGEVLMDNSFWVQASALTPGRARRAFAAAGIGWAFVPFAMSTLAFVGLATMDETSPVMVVPLVVARYTGPVGLWLLALCVWLAALSSTGAILSGLVTLILREWAARWPTPKPEPNRLQLARWLAVILSAIPLGISSLRPTSLIDVIIWLGVINAAFLGPFLVGVCGRRLTSAGATVAALLSLGLGYGLYNISPWYGVISSGLCSLVLCALQEALLTLRGFRAGS